MIDLSVTDVYQTTGGKTVLFLPQSRDLHGQRIYVALVSGYKGWRHYTPDGRVFGDQDRTLDLKEQTE